jgi:hypothetical protein
MSKFAEMEKERLRRRAERWAQMRAEAMAGAAEREAQRKLGLKMIRTGLKEIYPKYPYGMTDETKILIGRAVKRLRGAC